MPLLRPMVKAAALPPKVAVATPRVLLRKKIQVVMPVICRVEVMAQRWSDDPREQRWLPDQVSAVEPVDRVSVRQVGELLEQDQELDALFQKMAWDQ